MSNLNEVLSTTDTTDTHVIPPLECTQCHSKTLELTDDGNKMCKCCSCGYILWCHGDISKVCYCIDCLDDEDLL